MVTSSVMSALHGSSDMVTAGSVWMLLRVCTSVVASELSVVLTVSFVTELFSLDSVKKKKKIK